LCQLNFNFLRKQGKQRPAMEPVLIANAGARARQLVMPMGQVTCVRLHLAVSPAQTAAEA